MYNDLPSGRMSGTINGWGERNMDVKAAAKAIRKGDISPVYLLYGSEKYQMKQFVEMLDRKSVV